MKWKSSWFESVWTEMRENVNKGSNTGESSSSSGASSSTSDQSASDNKSNTEESTSNKMDETKDSKDTSTSGKWSSNNENQLWFELSRHFFPNLLLLFSLSGFSFVSLDKTNKKKKKRCEFICLWSLDSDEVYANGYEVYSVLPMCRSNVENFVDFSIVSNQIRSMKEIYFEIRSMISDRKSKSIRKSYATINNPNEMMY